MEPTLKLKREGALWVTADGRFEIRHEFIGTTECECPEHLCRHPYGERDEFAWMIWDRKAPGYETSGGDWAFYGKDFPNFKIAKGTLAHEIYGDK